MTQSLYCPNSIDGTESLRPLQPRTRRSVDPGRPPRLRDHLVCDAGTHVLYR